MKPTYLSNSIAGAEYIISRHNLGDKVEVIKNGVEVAMPKQSVEDWKQKLLVQSELIYTMVANFYPEKNHMYLIDGWNLFNEKFPTISKKLVLVGYAPDEKFLWRAKANVFDRGLDNIIFLDSSDDISGLLSVTNVGILTSECEGCPNSVLEMMKSKVPVIVSKIPATEEIFEASYPLFCELGDPNSLLLALEKTLSNHLISDVVNKNFKNVNSNYNFAVLKRNYLNLVG
jgi:glycosyltransferase involved in cell wall biosynthesis